MMVRAEALQSGPSARLPASPALRSPATARLSASGVAPGRAKLAVTMLPAISPNRGCAALPERMNIRVNSHCPTAPARITNAENAHGEAYPTSHTKKGRKRRALPTRLARAAPRVDAGCSTPASRRAASNSSHPPEPALTALEISHRQVQITGLEVGPEGGGDPEFGVGDLPQEKV